jgi:hypothetical protein
MKRLNNLPSPQLSEWSRCFYVNATSTIQIVRIANIENWYFERVVLPGMHVLFEAPSEAFLDIYDSVMISGVLADRISCQQLACTPADLDKCLAAKTAHHHELSRQPDLI